MRTTCHQGSLILPTTTRINCDRYRRFMGQLNFQSDGLGSTAVLTDDQGEPVATYDYDVFGAIRAGTGDDSTDIVGEEK